MNKKDILAGKYDNFLLGNGHKIMFDNPIRCDHYRRRKSGTLKLIGKYEGKNGITNLGRNLLLNVMFNDVTAIANASWFIGLIDNASFSTLAAADVMGSHAGWIENQDYTESTRVAWGSGTSTAQSTTNASPAQFDMNATKTINGIFVTSVGTKGGSTGSLWSTASFSSTVPVVSSDQLKITYTITD